MTQRGPSQEYTRTAWRELRAVLTSSSDACQLSQRRDGTDDDDALSSDSDGEQRRTRGDDDALPVFCMNCRAQGHAAVSCPHPLRCYTCLQPTHEAYVCVANPVPGSEAFDPDVRCGTCREVGHATAHCKARGGALYGRPGSQHHKDTCYPKPLVVQARADAGPTPAQLKAARSSVLNNVPPERAAELRLMRDRELFSAALPYATDAALSDAARASITRGLGVLRGAVSAALQTTRQPTAAAAADEAAQRVSLHELKAAQLDFHVVFAGRIERYRRTGRRDGARQSSVATGGVQNGAAIVKEWPYRPGDEQRRRARRAAAAKARQQAERAAAAEAERVTPRIQQLTDRIDAAAATAHSSPAQSPPQTSVYASGAFTATSKDAPTSMTFSATTATAQAPTGAMTVNQSRNALASQLVASWEVESSRHAAAANEQKKLLAYRIQSGDARMRGQFPAPHGSPRNATKHRSVSPATPSVQPSPRASPAPARPAPSPRADSAADAEPRASPGVEPRAQTSQPSDDAAAAAEAVVPVRNWRSYCALNGLTPTGVPVADAGGQHGRIATRVPAPGAEQRGRDALARRDASKSPRGSVSAPTRDDEGHGDDDLLADTVTDPNLVARWRGRFQYARLRTTASTDEALAMRGTHRRLVERDAQAMAAVTRAAEAKGGQWLVSHSIGSAPRPPSAKTARGSATTTNSPRRPSAAPPRRTGAAPPAAAPPASARPSTASIWSRHCHAMARDAVAVQVRDQLRAEVDAYLARVHGPRGDEAKAILAAFSTRLDATLRDSSSAGSANASAFTPEVSATVAAETLHVACAATGGVPQTIEGIRLGQLIERVLSLAAGIDVDANGQ